MEYFIQNTTNLYDSTIVYINKYKILTKSNYFLYKMFYQILVQMLGGVTSSTHFSQLLLCFLQLFETCPHALLLQLFNINL